MKKEIEASIPLQYEGEAPAANSAMQSLPAPTEAEEAPGYSRKNPFPGKLLKNHVLNKEGSAKEIRHVEICLNGSGLEYEAGDALGVGLVVPQVRGADLVVHSTTKFLTGNGTVIGGAVVDSGRFDWSSSERFKSLAAPEPAYHGLSFQETFGDLAFTTYSHAVSLRDLGTTLSPQNAFLTLLGIETLALRMERHCENAAKVAAFLEGHPAVAWVSHPSLASSPYHARAKKYLPKGSGSVFTCGLKGGYAAGSALVERVNLWSHLANLGDAKSLVLHPASTTHRQLTEAQRTAAGAGDEVVRLSVGIETAEDLIEDLRQALEGV